VTEESKSVIEIALNRRALVHACPRCSSPTGRRIDVAVDASHCAIPHAASV